jgi:hypothetical protein
MSRCNCDLLYIAAKELSLQASGRRVQPFSLHDANQGVRMARAIGVARQVFNQWGGKLLSG